MLIIPSFITITQNVQHNCLLAVSYLLLVSNSTCGTCKHPDIQCRRDS